jgi:hypothetical protein
VVAASLDLGTTIADFQFHQNTPASGHLLLLLARKLVLGRWKDGVST